MRSLESHIIGQQDLTQLHAGACMMMTRFVIGPHCPKLAHVIVHQLQKLLAHPITQESPDSRAMYSQLLEHWQNVSNALLAQKQTSQATQLYH